MKKEFKKAEVEVIRFEKKDDIVTQSTSVAGAGEGSATGGGTNLDEIIAGGESASGFEP